MNFPFKKPPGIIVPSPRRSAGPLKASWSRDPKTGRLAQSWREADDGERSCTARPGGRSWGRGSTRPSAGRRICGARGR